MDFLLNALDVLINVFIFGVVIADLTWWRARVAPAIQLEPHHPTEFFVSGGKQELLSSNLHRITYNTGDVVVLHNGAVIRYETHDGLSWKKEEA